MTAWARLTWQAADPVARAVELCRALGIAPPERSAQPGAVDGGVVRLALGSTALEVGPWRAESATDRPHRGGRLVFEPVPGGEAEGAAAEPVAGGPPPVVLVGVAWATVDLDRAEADLAAWLAPPGPDERPATRDPHLGATTRTRFARGLPGERIVLAEASTEGRLAASLARDGEGPCGLYLAPRDGLAAWLAVARGRHVRTSTVRDGPLGRSVLLPGGPVAGPHVLIVDGVPPSPSPVVPGTIRP